MQSMESMESNLAKLNEIKNLHYFICYVVGKFDNLHSNHKSVLWVQIMYLLFDKQNH